jgi:hypothetical protein
MVAANQRGRGSAGIGDEQQMDCCRCGRRHKANRRPIDPGSDPEGANHAG